MKDGNWVPISKGFLKYLPKDRQYTNLEAAYSLQIDYDCKNMVTVAGYADLWQWSRKRVYKFLAMLELEILYPEDTQKNKNQKGFLGVHKRVHKRDIKDKKGVHIRFIENSMLQPPGDIKDKKGVHKRNIKGSTTIDPITPNPNLNPKTKKPFVENSTEFQLAEYLLKLILNRNPGFTRPDMQTWAQQVDYMLRIDNRPAEDIRAVIKWCQADPFWDNNILSTEKLRKQFDQLFLKMKRQAEKSREKSYAEIIASQPPIEDLL